jgi:hypothetical protein
MPTTVYATVSQLRERLTTGWSDDALQRLLIALSHEIDTRLGPPGSRTERYVRDDYYPYIFLSRQAASITSVVDGTTTLATSEYELHFGGWALRRKSTSERFARDVTVTYMPLDDTERRAALIVDLAAWDVAHQGGVSSTNVGEFAEVLALSRDDIWRRHAPLPALGFV